MLAQRRERMRAIILCPDVRLALRKHFQPALALAHVERGAQVRGVVPPRVVAAFRRDVAQGCGVQPEEDVDGCLLVRVCKSISMMSARK